MQHEWPGNVRELQNRIHRAMLVCGGGVITPEHLGLAAQSGPSRQPPQPGAKVADSEREPDQNRRRGRALQRAGGIVSKAAAELGISRQAFYRRMDQAGVVLERRLKSSR